MQNSLYILATFKNKWLFQMIMKGTIVNFRVGMKTMYHNHMIINAGLSKREEAAKLIGKTVVFTTIFLIAVGTLLFYFFEQNNSSTLGSLTFSQKIMASYFHSVTPRTAGFNTLSIDKFYVQSLLLTILLMFIGASPGGTGGGIKTTTFALIFATIWATLKGNKNILRPFCHHQYVLKLHRRL